MAVKIAIILGIKIITQTKIPIIQTYIQFCVMILQINRETLPPYFYLVQMIVLYCKFREWNIALKE